MSRTLNELVALGNPFTETPVLAQRLAGRRSDTHMRHWATGEVPGLGALTPGVLATYGLVVARDMVRSWHTVVTSVEQWLTPPGDAMAGQVARLDIARVATRTSRDDHTRTTVRLSSPGLSFGASHNWHTAIRLQVDSTNKGLYRAQVALLEARDQPDGTSFERAIGERSLNTNALSLLAEGRIAEFSYPTTIHGIVPLVVDCNRFLEELAAGTEAAGSVQVPLDPTMHAPM